MISIRPTALRWKVILHPDADYALDEELSVDDALAALSRIGLLATQINPLDGYDTKKIHVRDPITYRARAGNYRIFFALDSDKHIMNVLSIERRSVAFDNP
jgi:mRNA-degrading endonuclease RelE of RelBE toxin-antitoxin system